MSDVISESKWENWNISGGPKYPHEKVVQFTFRNFPSDSRKNTKVLDLGCGSGVHAIFFAMEGFEVYGTDISEVGIKNTISKIKENGLSGQFDVQSIDNIAYPDNFFNYVISIGVLDCAGPELAFTAIKEIIRVLDSGGKAFLCFASNEDFRVLGSNSLGLYGFNEKEVEAMIPKEDLSIRWIDRYITTYQNQKEQQNDFLITLQKE